MNPTNYRGALTAAIVIGTTVVIVAAVWREGPAKKLGTVRNVQQSECVDSGGHSYSVGAMIRVADGHQRCMENGLWKDQSRREPATGEEKPSVAIRRWP